MSALHASRRLKSVLAGLLLSLAGAAAAQTTGHIDGQVSDPSGGPLPGVTIEARSPALQGARTTSTGVDGRFRVPSVPPGVYTVRASLTGFATAEKVAYVTLDATATVTMTMRVALEAQVVVNGVTPVLDLTSASSGTTFTEKVLRRMALGRNYAEIALSQPGTNTDTATTLNGFSDRVVNVTIYGSTSLENLYLIDAVNTTQVARGFQGKVVNPESLQEVEIKTGGYQAEYGRALGGVINVVTKSGGNDYHGDVFGNLNTRGMRAEAEITDRDILAAEQTEVLRWDAGANLGGYLMKDKLWFFGSYDRVEQEVTRIPQAGPVARQRFTLDRGGDIYSAKLTWNAWAGASLVASVLADPEDAEGPINLPNSTSPLTYSGTRKVGGHDYAFRGTQLFGSTGLLNVQFSHHSDRFQTEIPPEAELPRVTDRTVPGIAVASGGFGNINNLANYTGRRDSPAASFTAFLGSHELKGGGDYESNRQAGVTRRTGGELLTIRPCKANPSSPASVDRCAARGGVGAPFVNWRGENVPGGVVYTHDYLTNLDGSPALTIPNEVASRSYSAFVQDTWRLSSRLTVNAGLRWDREQIRSQEGRTVIDLDGEWSPRAGFVWDFLGDGTSRVHGSFGRFYYQFPTDLNFRAYGNDDFIFVNASNYVRDSLVNDTRTPFPGAISTPLGDEPSDANLKGMYQDEWALGVERALTPTFVVGLKGHYQRLGRVIEDRCDLDFEDPANHGQACAIINPGASEKYARGDFPCNNRFNERPDAASYDARCNENGGAPIGDASRIYRGIELTVRKSFTERFWTQASYIFSSLRGNYDGAARLVSGQSDPGVNADFDYFQFYEKNAHGKLYLDRPHSLQVSASYVTAFGLTAGLSAYLRSGPPLDKGEYFNGGYTQEFPGVQRGTAGRAATQYEANVSLAYEFRAGAFTISPRLYVFNVLNRQGEVRLSSAFNPDGSFDQNGNAIQHPDYGKILERQQPRLFRVSLRLSY